MSVVCLGLADGNIPRTWAHIYLYGWIPYQRQSQDISKECIINIRLRLQVSARSCPKLPNQKDRPRSTTPP